MDSIIVDKMEESMTMEGLIPNIKEHIFYSFHIFNDPLYLLIIPYCIGQPIFRRYCETYGIYEKKKATCKNIMCIYNLVLAVFSAWCCLYMIYALNYEIPAGVYGLGHYDKKDVIWLQYLHHIGAPLDTGIWHNHGVEGTWIYVVFNGFIHTIMYYYYACCIMKWPFPLKRMITNLQLLQFVSGLCVVIPYAWADGFWTVPEKRFAFLFNYGYVLMNLVMFINFYRQTYILKKKTA